MENKKKYLFGWENIRWGIIELIKLGSNQPSYFSKKRIESGIAFGVMEYGMLHFLAINISNMQIDTLIGWAAVQGVICGYNIREIQKEKRQLPPQ